VPSELLSVVVARVLGSSLPSRRFDALRVFRQAPTASPLKVGGFSLGLGARSGDPRCPCGSGSRFRAAPDLLDSRSRRAVQSASHGVSPRSASLSSPADRLVGALRCPCGLRHGPGSQPRTPPITTFLRSSWVIPNCLATIFRPLPLTGFALQSFSPQSARRRLAPSMPSSALPLLPEPRPRGVAVRPGAVPLRRHVAGAARPLLSWVFQVVLAVARLDATFEPACAASPWVCRGSRVIGVKPPTPLRAVHARSLAFVQRSTLPGVSPLSPGPWRKRQSCLP